MKQVKWLAILSLIVLTGLLVINCPSPTEASPEEPSKDSSLPVGDGTTWYYRAFGQSVDLVFNNVANAEGQNGINNVWINPNWIEASKESTFVQSSAQIAEAIKADKPVKLQPEDQVLIDSRGGKLANGHDGITFFFTVLPTNRLFTMTADVTKVFHGFNPNNVKYQTNPATSSNGQSGGGIMVRDAIGDQRQEPAITGFEELPAVSNFVGAGWTNNTNLVSMYRDGCTSITSAWGVPSISTGTAANGTRVDNKTEAGTKLTYILERTNDGFYLTVNEGDTNVMQRVKVTSNADLVQRVDGDKMYWGFFAAREARLLVENIRVEDTGIGAITSTNPPLSSSATPAVSVQTRSRTSTATPVYVLSLRPNYAGLLKVFKGDTLDNTAKIHEGIVGSGEEANISVFLNTGENVFKYQFAPDDINAPATGSITDTVRVTLANTSPGLTVFAAPANSGDGSGSDPANPKAVSDAVANAQPGQTIYLIAGDYSNTAIVFTANNSGVQGKYIKIEPVPGVPVPLRVRNIALGGYYVHAKNFITGGTSDQAQYNGNAITVNGDYNILELCIAEYCNNTGINSGGSSNTLNPYLWPKYNIYLNCTSRYNRDAAANNADGFGGKRIGPGNEYTGCVSHNNVDDGWDFFTWVDSGPSLPATLTNCITYNNGHNGFKLGGETQPVGHIVKNSIAYDNGMAGFSDNFNPGPLVIEGCISIDNLDQNYLLRDNTIIKPTNQVRDSISYRSEAKRDKGKPDAISGTVINSYIIDAQGVSQKNGGTALTDISFKSLNRDEAYTRDFNGNLIRGNFGKLKE